MKHTLKNPRPASKTEIAFYVAVGLLAATPTAYLLLRGWLGS